MYFNMHLYLFRYRIEATSIGNKSMWKAIWISRKLYDRGICLSGERVSIVFGNGNSKSENNASRRRRRRRSEEKSEKMHPIKGGEKSTSLRVRRRQKVARYVSRSSGYWPRPSSTLLSLEIRVIYIYFYAHLPRIACIIFRGGSSSQSKAQLGTR